MGSPESQYELGRLLCKVLKIYRLRIIHFNFKVKKNEENESNKRLKKDLVKKLNTTLALILDYLGRDVRSNKLKFGILSILLKNSFDRCLFRRYLNKYINHEPSISFVLFEDTPFLSLKLPYYLDCLSFFGYSDDNSPLNKKRNAYLNNDEFEENFFDQVYMTIIQDEIFSDCFNETCFLNKIGTHESFEEKHSLIKKMYSSIRKQFDDPFFSKQKFLATMKYLINYQYFISYFRQKRM